MSLDLRRAPAAALAFARGPASGAELNVMFSESQLLGEWRSKDGTVTLLADGTFVTPEGQKGRWRRSGDFGIWVEGAYWRVIEDDGELMLLPTPGRDPDSYDDWRVYRRER